MYCIEIMRRMSNVTDENLKIVVFEVLNQYEMDYKKDTIIRVSQDDISSFPELVPHVKIITFANFIRLPTSLDQVNFFVYKVQDGGAEEESIETEGEEINVSNRWLLPTRDFVGLWESLIYEEGIKENILNFVGTSMLFSRRNVDTHIITCNRLVLLHGPPGTGKTSLCKALAQKLAIQLRPIYKFIHLIEINSHSLFSKWFSESGKLVQKLFSSIHEIAEDKHSLAIVLIDEVESIAYARNAISSNEPSDSIRVVNAVLTQLDRIRKFPNVLILSTSNLTASIDQAFLDRADIVQKIGYPSHRGIYEIYLSAIKELQKAEIVEKTLNSFADFQDNKTQNSESEFLFLLAKDSHGLSGRALRKIPFLAHALFLKQENTQDISLYDYLVAMQKAIDKTKFDKAVVDRKPNDEQVLCNGFEATLSLQNECCN